MRSNVCYTLLDSSEVSHVTRIAFLLWGKAKTGATPSVWIPEQVMQSKTTADTQLTYNEQEYTFIIVKTLRFGGCYRSIANGCNTGRVVQ